MNSQYAGYLIATFLSGNGLDYIDKVNEDGLSNYERALFKSIKSCYEEKREVDLHDIDIDFGRALEIMDTYLFLSLSMDYCIAAIEKDARNKTILDISSRLIDEDMDLSLAVEKLSNLGKSEAESLLDVSKLEYNVVEPAGAIETGFYEYDSHVNDLKPGEITIIQGRNGEGKTTFISQVLAHCLSKKTKTFLYSGELSENKVQDWLYRQVVGADREAYEKHVTKYGFRYYLKKRYVEAIKEWHKDTLYLFNRKPSKRVKKEVDRLFGSMETANTKGVKLFIIDNLMAALESCADSLYSDQSNFVKKCKRFAVNNNVHVVLMAHPNKEKKELTGETGNLEKTDISGSNDIPNLADNIIAVERVWAEERNVDAIVTSLKDRESGQRKVIRFLFDHETLRFYNDVTKRFVNYGWEKHLKPEVKTAKYYNGNEQRFENGEIGG